MLGDPGYVERHSWGDAKASNPESRDSGSGPSDHPGMTGWGLRHFLLQDFGEAVEAVFRGDLSKDRLLDQRHAIGIDLAAPAGVGEIRADDPDREGVHEAGKRRVFGKFRLVEDRLARRQKAERRAVFEARLLLQHEAHELPRAFLVPGALEHGERLGEPE